MSRLINYELNMNLNSTDPTSTQIQIRAKIIAIQYFYADCKIYHYVTIKCAYNSI